MRTCVACQTKKPKAAFRYRQKRCKRCQIKTTGWGGKVNPK